MCESLVAPKKTPHLSAKSPPGMVPNAPPRGVRATTQAASSFVMTKPAGALRSISRGSDGEGHEYTKPPHTAARLPAGKGTQRG